MGVLKKCGIFLATFSTALINNVAGSLCQHRHKSTNFLFSPKEILIFFVECRVLCKFEHPLSKP